MIWFAYATLAALFWGMEYALMERVMKKMSMGAVFMACGLASVIFGAALSSKSLVADWETLKKGGAETWLFTACVAAFIIANSFILLSIKSRNATMAATIEIAYPLFTALFAWLFFKEQQFNAATLAGALLIISGVACVYVFGKAV